MEVISFLFFFYSVALWCVRACACVWVCGCFCACAFSISIFKRRLGSLLDSVTGVSLTYYRFSRFLSDDMAFVSVIGLYLQLFVLYN